MSERPAEEISRLTDRLFREEAGKLVSILTGLFGLERLEMAEDVVQEAIVRALRTWPFYGVPDKPAAWLMQTAKHLALDLLRRERLFQNKQPEIIAHLEHWPGEEGEGSEPAFETEMKDGRLRLLFACCHPQLAPEAQTALALKTLCGFGVMEISKAFLTTEAAIAKRLTRARQSIRDLGIPFEIPAGEELASRLAGVLQTVYLLFNEGYKASTGPHLVREDLCQEAIRLAALLAEHPLTGQPQTHALLALMLLNAARHAERQDAAGQLLRLAEQDRANWNKPMIARGLRHLSQSVGGSEITEYHLQAGIAAHHSAAESYEATDWPRIVGLYDQLLRINGSPVVALNRAVALSRVEGPAAGIAAVEAISDRQALSSYHLYHAVLAELEAQLHRYDAAAAHLRRALVLTEVETERMLLARRLEDCEKRMAAIGRPDSR